MGQRTDPSKAYIPPSFGEQEVQKSELHQPRAAATAAILAVAALASTSIGTSHAEAPVREAAQHVEAAPHKHRKHHNHSRETRVKQSHAKHIGQLSVRKKESEDPKPSHYLKWMKKRDDKHCSGIDSGYSMYRIGMGCKGDRANVLHNTYDPKTGKLVSLFGEVHHHGRVICGAFRPGVFKVTHVNPAYHSRCESYYQKKQLRNHFVTAGRSNAAAGECVGGTPFKPRKNGQKTLYQNFATSTSSPTNLYPTAINSGFYDRVGSLQEDERSSYRFQHKYGSPDGKAAEIITEEMGWVAVHDSGPKDLVPGIPRDNCLKKQAWMVAGSHPVSDAIGR